jgi:hypothetical protein
MYNGNDRRHYFDLKTFQFNLKRNFAGNWGFMVNYSRLMNSYHKIKWDPGDPDQFVYASPSDVDMINYGIGWVVHGSLFYRFPYDIMVSAYIRGQEGKWYNDVDGDYAWNDDAPRVTLANGRRVGDIVWQAKNSYWAGRKFGESGRYADDMWQINFRFQKGIRISSVRVMASIDLFNVFNLAGYDNFGSMDIRHPRYDEIRSPQTPRSAQLNLRIEF